MIDLRSDTVTRPDEGMRRAMYNAEVGDDVFGEDPTVTRLQEEVAGILGMESALYIPSGMMGNQLGIHVHTRPGDEVIVERSCHIFNYESGAAGSLSGVVLHVLDGERGLITCEQLAGAVRHGYYWESASRLLCLENTLNKAGGVVYPLDRLQELTSTARAHGLALHLDGARLWNATAASGIPERQYAELFDTVTVCLSKGLGAPVGSVFAGSKEAVEAAHHRRKVLGGGMRQVGLLAAAGLYAIRHHRNNLGEDHQKARQLAEGLRAIKGLRTDPPESNIVLIDIAPLDALPLLESLRSDGVAMVPLGPHTLRAVTHRDIAITDIDRALRIMQRVVRPQFRTR